MDLAIYRLQEGKYRLLHIERSEGLIVCSSPPERCLVLKQQERRPNAQRSCLKGSVTSKEKAFRAEQNNVKHVLTLLVCFILSKLIVSDFCVHSVSPLVQKSPPVNANREVICIFEEYITAPFYWT